MPTFKIEVQEHHGGRWTTVSGPVVVDAARPVDALGQVYAGLDVPPAGRTRRVLGWSDPEAPGPPDVRLDTIAVPRAALRTGDKIVVRGRVCVTREPVKWELTAPTHWVWTRDIDSPELARQQLAEMNGDRAFDGTGYGFLSLGPDHIYEKVIDPTWTP